MILTAPERRELERRVASRRGRADEARRARCILLVTAGIAWAEIRAQLVRPYVEAAASLGATRLRVLLRHALPNTLAPVIALATLGVGNAITLEAGLSFLGLGVQPPTASWGTMIASGRDTVVNAPWVGLAPGIALVLVVVACTLVADAVQDRR